MSKQQGDTLQFRLKRVILIAFLFMLLGTMLELYLLDHYEGIQQLIPIFCIGASILMLGILYFKRNHVLEGTFKMILGLTALSGIYGTYLHLRANYEFEQEMKPTADNWTLFMESMSGALPALAPLSMIVSALLGYSYLILIRHKQ